MAAIRKPVCFTSSVDKLSMTWDAVQRVDGQNKAMVSSPAGGYRSLDVTRSISSPMPPPLQVIAPSTQFVHIPNTKEEALIDALQASTAANEALEAVIKLQARAIEEMMQENKRLVQQAKQAHLKNHEKPVMCEGSTQVLAEEAAMFSLSSTLDTSVQTGPEGNDVSTVQAALDVLHPVPRTAMSEDDDLPRFGLRIQPPAVPPTPRKVSKTHTPKGSPRVAAPSSIEISKANAEAQAEAFRLGWLAGVKSNSMAANKSPSSTRSDDSQPSDPGSYVVGSRGSESGDSRGSLSPPGPNDKLPALPTLMPPPPPPALMAPPEIPFEQLAQLG